MSCIIKYKGQSIPEEQFLQYLNKQIAINNLFNENESLANSVYEALGFKTIPSDISKIKDFEGTIIEYVEHIGTHKDGREIGARNINKGEKIQVVLNEMRKKFEEKSWVNPVNSEPLSQDAFSSFEELMMFMYLHEKAHEYILQEEGESSRSYETRVNNEALKRLNAEFKITPQQKRQAQQLYSQYLDSIGVTDIAYHHSEEDISEFTSSSERYFQKELKKKNKYIPKLDDIVFLVKKPLTEEFMSKRKFIGSWGLKTPKTLQFNAGEKIGEGVHPGIDEGIFAGIEGNYDAIDFGRIRDNKTWSEVIAITNPKNAIIRF